MNERLQPFVLKLIDGARRLVLLASVLGVALHMDPTAADTTVPKLFWFGLAAGLIPALTFLRLWWGGRLRLAPANLILWGLGLAALVTLSYLLSPYRAVATAGWQGWLLSLLLFIASVDLMAAEGGERWLLGSLMLAAGLAGAWSLAQRLGLDSSLIGRMSVDSFGPRIAGSLGNPNFAGGFFVLVLPVLLHQALAGEGPWWRRGASLSSLLALLGLGLSASKAAAFGLLAMAAVGGHCLYWSKASAEQKKHALYSVGSVLLAGLLAALLLLQAPARQRLLGGAPAWRESIRFRMQTWSGAMALQRERPLVGFGPGTFSVAYPSHRPAAAMAVQVQHSYEVTHPENWLLQVMAELGLPALAVLILFLLNLLWPWRERSRDWAEDPQGAGLLLALLSAALGSLACNLASLDLFLPSTLLPLIFLLALGVVRASQAAPVISLNPENYARLLISAGLAFLATTPVVGAQMRWQSSRLLRQARDLSQEGKFAEAVPQYQIAVDLDPLNLEARYFLAKSLQDQGPAKLKEAEQAFQELSLIAPDYVLIHACKARLYTVQGRPDLAELEWKRQLELDPYLLQAYQELGSLYAGQGRLAEAQALLEQAEPKFPEQLDIRVNLEALRRAQKKGKRS
jgi:O-antigen ligase/Flp pilus assembly protein TadD